MTFSFSNQSETDVYVFVNRNKHCIKSGQRNVLIEGNEKKYVVTIKRANPIPLPQYRTVLATEILGPLALLFVKPWSYTVDVSSSYFFPCDKDIVLAIEIVKTTNPKNAEVMYDAIVASSPQLRTSDAFYCAENKAEICALHKRSRRTAHFWLYFTFVFFFSLIGLVETYVFSLILHSFAEDLSEVILLLFFPLFLISVLALFLLITLSHLLFKKQDKKFYALLEQEGITSHLHC